MSLRNRLFRILLFVAALIAPWAGSDAKPRGKAAIEKAFFAENARKPGVITTKSGLQYEILAKGDGGRHPKFRQTIVVHYHGTLVDGTVFQSTLARDKPIAMKFEGVVSGWKEGLRLMSVGDKFRFYIPSRLGYGFDKVEGIPYRSILIFEIELFGIE